jgi:pyruvate dehydrogenase E1 component alpha subunit
VRAPSIAARAAGYGLPGVVVDGNDPLAVLEVVAAAVARARSGGGATYIEARTVRMGGHLSHDPQLYRPREEIEAALAQCPIRRFRARLGAEGALDDEGYGRMEAEVESQVDAAVAFARQSPFPDPSEAFEDLWA